jgi:hypothetical protein
MTQILRRGTLIILRAVCHTAPIKALKSMQRCFQESDTFSDMLKPLLPVFASVDPLLRYDTLVNKAPLKTDKTTGF